MLKVYNRREKSIRRDIRHVWRETVSNEKYIPATKLLAISADVGQEKSQSINNQPVLNRVLVQDEVSLTLSILCLSTLESITSTDTKNRVRSIMAGALAGHLHAIRTLITQGYDVQARALCRTISEHVDLMLILFDNDDLCVEYQQIQEYDHANKFWHQHVSKGKTRTEVCRAVSARSKEAGEGYKELLGFVSSEEKMLGTIVHPSYLASAMVIGMGVSHGQGGMGMFGVVDAASVRTLNFIFCRLIELFILCRESMIELADLYSSSSKFISKTEMVDRITFCGNLLLYVAAHRDRLPIAAASVHQ